ncbi:MAG: RagB/SusD family nutrient uptake outer membrane protein [Alistipes sp.]
MLKRQYTAIIALICACIFNGCTNLDEYIYSSIPEDDFYKTESEFMAAMVPVYANMRNLTDHSSWWDLEETTDICFTPVKAYWAWYDGGIYIRLHQHSWMEEDTHLNKIWSQLFTGVSDANRVLFQFENSTVEMKGKEKFISELKVARAFYYYLLIEAFGNVPIIDRFDVPEGYLPATKSRTEVFHFIEKELQENKDNLADKSLESYGRFNKWNARMLLVRLYLNAEAWIGIPMYKECDALCDEIISSGKYKLDDDYSMPFSVSNSLSNETMFVIPFDETKTSGNQIYMQARKTRHPAQIATYNLSGTWFDSGSVGVPSFFDNYIDGDKRLQKSWAMGQQYALDGSELWTGGWVDGINQPLIYSREVQAIDGPATMVEGYRFAKYEIKVGGTATPDNDYVIMRYAEVLMAKAECILRMGGDAEDAATLVNDVRKRAFDKAVPLTGVELEATINQNGSSVKYGRMLQELGVEFALEGLRRSQLIRFDDNFSRGSWAFHSPTNDLKRNLMLIPFDQLQRNSNLKQNPK